MKPKTTDLNSIPFPQSPIASGPSWEELPSFPAFPVGGHGSDIYMAIPTLVFVPVSGLTAADRMSALDEAVAALSESEMALIDPLAGSQMTVGFASMARTDGASERPLAGTRNDLLRRLLAETGRWLDEVSSEPKKATEADQVSAEIGALLSMFGAVGESDFLTGPSL